ncbi:MAG: endonuclease V, partial [Methanomassiliicoccales archaeon]
PDLYDLVYRATKQVPEGMLTTYGDIARALGDIRASRAVGMIMARNPYAPEVPCHRVVYSTGEVGWYGGKGSGSDRKQEMLREEGVEIKEGRVVDFPRRHFQDIEVDPVLTRMREEQCELRAKVTTESPSIDRVIGVDVSYHEDRGYVAAAEYDPDTGEMVEERTAEVEVHFPYITTYLSYREIPALQEIMERREGTAYLVDGQGILHPRRFGIACHLGVLFDMPTIGAAKSPLCGEIIGKDIVLQGERMGTFMGEGKGVYVSPGHRMDLETAREVCGRFLRHRVPEPLRRAHLLANELRRSGG